MRIVGYVLTVVLGSANAACTINSVNRLPTGSTASPHRAVIVYGVKVEGSWPHARFTVQLDEYDLAKHNISGNCFRFNRAEARIAAAPGAVTYVAFDVPPGHYVYSRFNGAPLSGEVVAFEAPVGKNVYLGNFVFEKSGVVSLTRDFETVRADISTALPGLEKQLSLAKVKSVERPRAFLCTP